MPRMKRLIFGRGLMELSLNRSKTFTVRKYRDGAHDFVKDEIVIGEFQDGFDILIRITEDTLKQPFKALRRSKKEAKKTGGHWLDKTYFNNLKSYYYGLTWNTMGAVIFFEILKVNDVPVVRFNEYA